MQPVSLFHDQKKLSPIKKLAQKAINRYSAEILTEIDREPEPITEEESFLKNLKENYALKTINMKYTA